MALVDPQGSITLIGAAMSNCPCRQSHHIYRDEIHLKEPIVYMVDNVLQHCNDINLNKKDTITLFGTLYPTFEQVKAFQWNQTNVLDVLPFFKKISNIIQEIRSAMAPRNTVFALVLEETLKAVGYLQDKPFVNPNPYWCNKHKEQLNNYIQRYLIQPVNIIRKNMLQEVYHLIHETPDINIITELIATCPKIDVEVLSNINQQSIIHIFCMIGRDNEESISNCLKKIPKKNLQKIINLQRKDDKNTALHLASQTGKINIVKYLVIYGANTSLTNSFGQTALDVAANDNIISLIKKADKFDSPSYGNANLFTTLLKKNYPKEEPLPTNDFDLLYSAVSSSDVEMVKRILKRNKSCINEKNKFGMCLLLKAIGLDNVDIVRILLENGADTSVRYCNMNVLHYAVKKGDVRIVDALLDYIDNVNLPGKNGLTALHDASANGNVGIVELLLAHGANFEAKDNNKKTPWHCSINNDVSVMLRTIINFHSIVQEENANDEERLASIFLKIKSSKNSDIFWKATNNQGKTLVQLIIEKKGSAYRLLKTLFLSAPEPPAGS